MTGSDTEIRDNLLSKLEGKVTQTGDILAAAGMFAIAHQLSRIADVLEMTRPLIELGVNEARKEAASR